MANTQSTTKTNNQRTSASGKSSSQSPSESGAAGTTSDSSSSVQEDVGALTSQAAEQVRDAASGVKEQVRQQALGQVTTQKERAADELEMVAGLLRQASQQVSEQDRAPVAVSIDGMADRIDGWSETLRTQDVSDLLDEAKDLARRQPALFVGGALVAGFLTVRFFKSSPHSASDSASNASDRASDDRPSGERSSSDDQTATVLTDLEDLEALLPSSNDDPANEKSR